MKQVDPRPRLAVEIALSAIWQLSGKRPEQIERAGTRTNLFLLLGYNNSDQNQWSVMVTLPTDSSDQAMATVHHVGTLQHATYTYTLAQGADEMPIPQLNA